MARRAFVAALLVAAALVPFSSELHTLPVVAVSLRTTAPRTVLTSLPTTINAAPPHTIQFHTAPSLFHATRAVRPVPLRTQPCGLSYLPWLPPLALQAHAGTISLAGHPSTATVSISCASLFASVPAVIRDVGGRTVYLDAGPCTIPASPTTALTVDGAGGGGSLYIANLKLSRTGATDDTPYAAVTFAASIHTITLYNCRVTVSGNAVTTLSAVRVLSSVTHGSATSTFRVVNSQLTATGLGKTLLGSAQIPIAALSFAGTVRNVALEGTVVKATAVRSTGHGCFYAVGIVFTPGSVPGHFSVIKGSMRITSESPGSSSCYAKAYGFDAGTAAGGLWSYSFEKASIDTYAENFAVGSLFDPHLAHSTGLRFAEPPVSLTVHRSEVSARLYSSGTTFAGKGQTSAILMGAAGTGTHDISIVCSTLSIDAKVTTQGAVDSEFVNGVISAADAVRWDSATIEVLNSDLKVLAGTTSFADARYVAFPRSSWSGGLRVVDSAASAAVSITPYRVPSGTASGIGCAYRSPTVPALPGAGTSPNAADPRCVALVRVCRTLTETASLEPTATPADTLSPPMTKTPPLPVTVSLSATKTTAATSSYTETRSSTRTATASPSRTATAATVSLLLTATTTASMTSTAARTSSSSVSPTFDSLPTATGTNSAVLSYSITAARTQTVARARTPSWSGTATRTHTMHATLSASNSPTSSVGQSATESLAVTATPRRSKTSTRTAALATPRPERPPVAVPAVGEAAVAAAAAATTSAGVVASMAAGPAAAVQVGRAMSIFRLAHCSADHTAPVGFPEALLPWLRLGPDMGQYYRGAVVGNILVVALLSAAAAAAVAVLGHTPFCNPALSRKPKGLGDDGTSEDPLLFSSPGSVGSATTVPRGSATTWASSLTYAPSCPAVGNDKASRLLRTPGVLVIPCGVALDGVVASGVSLVTFGGGVGDIVLGVAALASVAALIAALLWAAMVHAPRMCAVVSVPPALYSRGPEDRRGAGATVPWPISALRPLRDGRSMWLGRETSSAVQRVLRERRAGDGALPDSEVPCSSGGWGSGDGFLARCGLCFAAYQRPLRWFLAADLVAAVAVSAAKGTRPVTTGGCRVALGAVCAVQCVLVLGAVGLRPYFSPLRNAVLVLASALLVVATAIRFVELLIHGASEPGDDRSTAEAVSEALALMAGYVQLATMAAALWRFVDSRWLGAPAQGTLLHICCTTAFDLRQSDSGHSRGAHLNFSGFETCGVELAAVERPMEDPPLPMDTSGDAICEQSLDPFGDLPDYAPLTSAPMVATPRPDIGSGLSSLLGTAAQTPAAAPRVNPFDMQSSDSGGSPDRSVVLFDDFDFDFDDAPQTSRSPPPADAATPTVRVVLADGSVLAPQEVISDQRVVASSMAGAGAGAALRSELEAMLQRPSLVDRRGPTAVPPVRRSPPSDSGGAAGTLTAFFDAL